MKEKYESLDAVNAAWSTAFWSQIYYDWGEVVLPRKLSLDPNPTMELDYYRFFSDAYVKLYQMEYGVVRSAVADDIPVATNLTENFFQLDQFKMAEVGDFSARDSYPDTIVEKDLTPAMEADLSRSLMPEKPWLLMEQVTNQIQWRPVNPLKRPGIMRLWSMSHVARGSDGAMFFQWRQSFGGSEKFHGAMVPIVGTENSRVWNEVCELGADLKKLQPAAGSLAESQLGIVMSWDCLWSFGISGKPQELDYLEEQKRLHRACWELGVTPDFVHPDKGDFNAYPFLIVPFLYMMSQTHAAKIREYVEQGGTLLMSCFSGLVDENDQFYQEGGYPAMLKDVFGLRIEEWDAQPAGRNNYMVFRDGSEAPCDLLFEIGQLQGGEALATYKDEFYSGAPVLTKQTYGSGCAHYVAARPATVEAWKKVIASVAPSPVLEKPVDAPDRVEVILRRGDEGERFLFLLNYTGGDAVIGLRELSGIDLLSGTKVAEKLTLSINGVAAIRMD